MKKAPIWLAVLAALFCVAHAQALTLSPGQSIGISFGAVTPDDNFNQCDPANPEIQTTGMLSTVIDTTGVTLAGVKLQFGGSDVVSSQAGTLQDYSHYSTLFTASNIQNGVSGYDLFLAFTGLDANQTFTLDIVCSYSSQNIGAEYFWNGASILTDSTSATGGTLAHFSNLVPDANGTITITAIGHDINHSENWSGINAALLTEVPEPSVWALCIFCFGAVLFYRFVWLKKRLF